MRARFCFAQYRTVLHGLKPDTNWTPTCGCFFALPSGQQNGVTPNGKQPDCLSNPEAHSRSL